jgi:hypothetical protein
MFLIVLLQQSLRNLVSRLAGNADRTDQRESDLSVCVNVTLKKLRICCGDTDLQHAAWLRQYSVGWRGYATGSHPRHEHQIRDDSVHSLSHNVQHNPQAMAAQSAAYGLSWFMLLLERCFALVVRLTNFIACSSENTSSSFPYFFRNVIHS